MNCHLLRALLPAIAAVLVGGGAAGAQTATATISGRVVDGQGLAMQDVIVTVQSPNLQSPRVTRTSGNGDYQLALLPPGSYTITFESPAFASRLEKRDVAAAAHESVSVTMTPAQVQHGIEITRPSGIFVGTIQSATNIPAATLALLPTDRTLTAAVDLSGGVHSTGPNRAPMISGGMSTENVFMLNGAQITENIFNAPQPLVVEDAIQEITTAVSGIPADYGRLTGGIVNSITRSGGDRHSGSFRTTLTNDGWRATSPFGEPKATQVVPTYEFTVGGPIVRRRTWFFGAGRLFGKATSGTVGSSAAPYTNREDEERFEAKLTQSLAAGQSVTIAYAHVERDITNAAFGPLLDVRSLADESQSQQLGSAHYTGALGARLFVEGQFISRNRTSARGGTSTDRIQGTMLQDRSKQFGQYWAPPFCAVCGDEQLDSTEVLAKGNYLVSTARGAHSVVFGYDMFNDTVLFDNHQTGSDYSISTTASITRDGVVYPVFDNDSTTVIVYRPILVPSRGWSFRTHALFAADTWRYDRQLTFNLGIRWDKNDGTDTSGRVVSTGGSLSPRLGIAWDRNGDGRTVVTGSFSRYVGAVDGPVGNAASPAGRPADFRWAYRGPGINTDPAGPLIPPDQALRMLFDWFDSVGGTELRPYSNTPLIPGVTTTIEGSVDSPTVLEYAVGLSRRLGARIVLRADAIYRDYRDFYALVTNPGTGKVTDSLGREFDLSRVENANAEKRRYAGVTVQGNSHVSDRLALAGNYTWSRLRGTFGLDGPGTTSILSFPEYRDARWSAPLGDHPADQRHRVRLWTTYRLPIRERIGDVTLAAIERIESGTPYGAVGSIDSRPYVTNPGYLNPPGSVPYFFTARDAFRTGTLVSSDLALNYGRRLTGSSGPTLFAQVQVLNLFNESELVVPDGGVDLAVLTRNSNPARYEAFNPFTTTPVRGVHWDYGPNFGRATAARAYSQPRTLLFSFGIRY